MLHNNIITEHHQIINLLNDENDSKFVTRKWNIVNDTLNSIYAGVNEIIYNRESNLFDYNDAYILLTGDITVVTAPITQVALKNCALFTKCITQIDGTAMNDTEDLDLVMSMYNLIKYSSNYFETPRTLLFYS